MSKSTEWVNDWARYRATDENGELWEYEHEPCIASPTGWDAPCGTSARVKVENWESSLEVRDMSDNCEWNGEGLPPVGTVCEYTSVKVKESRHTTERYFWCEILAHKNGKAVVYTNTGNLHLHGLETHFFRQLRTEREVVIGEMVEVFPEIVGGECCDEYNKRAVEALYDTFNITRKER